MSANNTQDRELLKLAAKAAGYALSSECCNTSGGIFLGNGVDGDLFRVWNPLKDDGDAFRLAVDTGLLVYIMKDAGFTGIRVPGEYIGGKYDDTEAHGNSAIIATRHVIVRAAASIAINSDKE